MNITIIFASDVLFEPWGQNWVVSVPQEQFSLLQIASFLSFVGCNDKILLLALYFSYLIMN